ncbi:insulinase family protein [Nostocaceae cyanobacterium CENA369]|uniref:Insulinase family protein n=1 Tax=Dendronalium phyllosphericum CENA369 TaxID=1725256 RepID=A0A8J7LDL5_9NOST|nr:pitrilysin family protein [Dendronalium phyllosphericum]MBH8574012.1 insulinase family protein [Dendronalium phyllosphericum CENA369]
MQRSKVKSKKQMELKIKNAKFVLKGLLRRKTFLATFRQIQRSQRLIFILIAAFAFLLLTFNFSLAATAEAKYYTELKFAPLPEIKLPKYERFVLQNGLVVYLIEDRELPLVNGTALVRTGSRLEPADKVGLAGFTGAVMRTGGTKQHSPDELNQILEQRAASVETSIGEASGGASFEALSEDLETVFGLFVEVLREPVFAAEKLDLAKTQARGGIARRNDNPDEIATREFRKLLYGKDSPYGRTIEYATVDRISREDLVKFYEQYFHPNNIILGIVGDFDAKKMRSLVQAKLGDWQPNPKITKPQLTEVSPANTGGVFFVNQPQLTQSSVLMGHLGGRFNNPDYPALDVLNGVLNGFGRRLFNELRSRQGLAYSVYGLWNPRFDYPGMFIAGGQTRSDATVQFVKALQAEIKRIQTQKVTAEELAFAKESTLNSFVFNFQDPSQTLSRLMRYEYYGYPADFLFRYQKAVAATTTADVQRVAKQYLKPENIVTLVVGNQTAIKPPLTQLAAKVTPIDVTIPSQPQAKN